MSDRIKLKTPNGGAEIEVLASEKKRFTDQGFTVVVERKTAAKSATKASEVKTDGDI